MFHIKSLMQATKLTFVICGFMIITTYVIIENERTDKVNIKIDNFKNGAILLCLDSNKENIHSVVRGNWVIERNQFIDQVNHIILNASDCVEVK